MTLDPCPVGPDTLRHLDAAEKRATAYDVSYTALLCEFRRQISHDPSGRIDVPGYGRAVLADIVYDMLDDADHADRRIRLLRVLANAADGSDPEQTQEDASVLLAELSGAYAMDCVDAAVGDMSNPD